MGSVREGERKKREMKRKRKKDRRKRQKSERRWESRIGRKGSGSDSRWRKRKELLERRVRSGQGEESGRNLSGREKGNRKECNRTLNRLKGVKGKQRGERKRLDGREGTRIQVRNRCVETGNGRSVRRWFRRSGRKVRERGRQGKLEGVFRVSW